MYIHGYTRRQGIRRGLQVGPRDSLNLAFTNQRRSGGAVCATERRKYKVMAEMIAKGLVQRSRGENETGVNMISGEC